MKTLEQTIVRPFVEWCPELNTWLDYLEVDWDYISPNQRVKARRAGFMPATLLSYDGYHGKRPPHYKPPVVTYRTGLKHKIA